MVASIVQAPFPGVTLDRPPVQLHQVVFASPHSGRQYPKRFMERTQLSLTDLRRAEDAYVDLLLPPAETIGVPVLAACFPRAFLDVNRSADDLDPRLFTGVQRPHRPPDGARAGSGFGVVPRLVASERPIYSEALPASEGRARIKHCHAPYHAELASLLRQTQARFGEATLIDWHSMPGQETARHGLADVVLGDRYGTSCSPAIRRRWEEAFRGAGLTVRMNDPYAGGHVTRTYGRPPAGVHVLQIELRRDLYLDERRVARSRNFPRFKRRLATIIEQALGMDETAHQAAE